MDLDEIKVLAQKYIQGIASEEEKRLLHEWYETVNRGDVELVLTENPTTVQEFGKEMLDELTVRIAEDQPVYSIKKRSIYWLRWLSAAAIVIILATGTYFYLNRTTNPSETTGKSKIDDVSAPSVARAMLKLDDGTIVYLDSVKNGSLAAQGNVNVVKTADGQITYTGTGNEVMYNTLSNPRGSKVVNLTLSDGTKVWLNSESSLRYPTAFISGERIVQITGEAYFEAAHDPSKPFIVKKNDVQVQVLGTHFNVNAYDDESEIKITLLEGSVKVSRSRLPAPEARFLSPGQQAQVNNTGQITVDKNADIEQVMAWKNGLFSFKGSDIKSVMRQLAKWYDVDVDYSGEVKEKFHVEVDRNTNVSSVFKILEATGGVHFKIEGKKITVLP